MELGIKGHSQIIVKEEQSASYLKSGTLPVFATPAMIALMEETALESVTPYLEEGFGTVGTHIDVDHLAACSVGDKVSCESVLSSIDRRKLTFTITCTAVVKGESVLIGKAVHDRFIIDNEKFMAKLS